MRRMLLKSYFKMQALLHELTTTVPLPKMDLFGVPPTQTMIERDIVTEHRPIATIDPTSFIQFEIQTAIDEYIDLEKLLLYMKVKLQRNSSIKAEADYENICPTNYLLHSMIKQVDVFVGDKQITSNSPTYAYKAYFEAFLGFSRDAKKSHMTSALWYNDENTKEDILVKEHSKYLKKSYILYEPKFYMNAKVHKPELELLEVSLFTHRSKVTQDLVEAHNIALNTLNVKYPITMSKVKAFTVHAGTYDACLDNIHSGQLPRRVFVCFVSNTAFCGDYNLNPFKFEHFNISSLAIYLDGVQYPSKAFTPDFTNNLYQREMYSLFEAIDMLDMDSTFYINRENYSKGNTIFGFNFAPDLSSGCGTVGHVNAIKYGSMRMNIRFSRILDQPITALVFCEFDKIMEIDKNRRAILENL